MYVKDVSLMMMMMKEGEVVEVLVTENISSFCRMSLSYTDDISKCLTFITYLYSIDSFNIRLNGRIYDRKGKRI